MLLKFRLKNYKSYKDLQEFSMIAGSTKLNDDRLYKENDFSILKFSAIYGANGAGKSNLVEALYYMQRIVVKGLPNYLQPIYYKLNNDEKNVPTYFETLLFLNGKIYTYGFEYDSLNNIITSEWLVQIKGKREIEVFSRDLANRTFNSDKKEKNKIQMYLDDMKEENTRLFLSFINYNKKSSLLEENIALKEVYDWFVESLNITAPESILTSGEFFLVEEKIERLAQLVDSFGTGIKAIGSVVVHYDIAIQKIPSRIIEEIKRERKEKIEKLSALIRLNNEMWNIIIEKDSLQFKKICFYHDIDKKYLFNLNDESEGTIRIIDIAEILLTEKENQLFVIDELDRKLHPQLTCKFVELFLEKAKKSNNQLIVTTHESRLLDFDILRRDEIWFSNKEESGESKLYSLEEFNVRFDKKIDKAYLDGRYGGVPIFNSVFPPFTKCQE